MGWPVVVAMLLALLGLTETVTVMDNLAPGQAPLLLALAMTLPVALARVHAGAAFVLLAVAAGASLLVQGHIPVTGIVALATVAGSSAYTRYRVKREEAARRRASEAMMASNLLEFAARGERARIARELHDVVAHHLSMISVQAETARLTTPGMPAEGAKRLSAIGDTARSALTEMRRLLGVLREDAGPAPEPQRRPQPGLQQLNELLDEARDHSAASTRLIVSGHVAPLDPGIELTAYRIVQEALTNARRHAPGAAVDVELTYGPEALRVRVRDNGPGPLENGTLKSGTLDNGQLGHGLTGMRERAAMVGGSLVTSAPPNGGFFVEAVLPT